MKHREPQNGAPRRLFLKQGAGLVALGATWTLLPLLGGCGSGAGEEEATGPLEVPLAMVPTGRRVNVSVHGHPVELLRDEDGVTARSLRCTHQGCKVLWHPDEELYICPCHEGKFDAEGEVVYGQPRRPLRLFQAEIVGEVIRVTS